MRSTMLRVFEVGGGQVNQNGEHAKLVLPPGGGRVVEVRYAANTMTAPSISAAMQDHQQIWASIEPSTNSTSE